MHSNDCLIRAADVGAALLAEKGMDGKTFDETMRKRFGREYVDNREAIFRASFGQYLDARGQAKAAALSRREAAYVDERTGPSRQGRLGEGFLSEAQVAQYKRDFARLLGERARATKTAAKARVDLATKYAALEQTSTLGVLRALRKSGFTMGIAVQARNLLSNAANQVLEGATTKPMAAIVDMITAADTRQRTVARSDLRLWGKSGYEGARDGVRDAWETLRHGATPEQLERLDLPPRTNSGHKYLDAYVSISARVSGAGDALFRGYAAKRSLASRAKAAALTELKAGKIKRGDVARRTAELYNAPTPDMELGALADASFLTFNNDNALAQGIEDFKRRGGEAGQLAAEIPLTYTRVPANIGLRFLDYLGGGLIRAGSAGRRYLPLKVGTAALAPFDMAGIGAAKAKRAEFAELMKTAFGADEATRADNQRRFAEMFARGMTGPGLAALGAYLASQGATPGYYTKEEGAERKRDEAAGIGEGSIVLGGRSYDIRFLGPAASVLLFGATIYHAYNDEGADPSKRAGKVLRAGKEALIQQTALLESAQNLSELAEHPERWAAFLGDTAQSYTPGINASLMRDVANATDTKERQAEPGDLSSPGAALSSGALGFVDAVARDIPFVRERLPERKDTFGRPLQHNRFDLVTRSKDVDPDLYISELRRLDMPAPSVKPETGEDPKAFRERAAATGQRQLEAGRVAVETDAYKRLARLPDGAELQRQVLKEAAERGKDAALATATDRAVFEHNTAVTARQAEVLAALDANPRFVQAAKPEQDRIKQAVASEFGGLRFAAEAGEPEDSVTWRFDQYRAELEAARDDAIVEQFLEGVFEPPLGESEPKLPAPFGLPRR